MTNPGTDYGNGATNIDHSTGIRYGVISQHDICQSYYDSAEPDYGSPHCPVCGNEVTDVIPDDEDIENYSPHGCDDYYCEHCHHTLDSSEVYGEEPLGYVLDDGEYQASSDNDGDIWLFKSPYFTYAQFCSPCAPGAGHLGNPCSDGPKTYCWGHDWFDDGFAPYPVFDVKTGKQVYADATIESATVDGKPVPVYDDVMGELYVFGAEYGPLRIVRAQSLESAYECHIDECETIPMEDVPEAYGQWDAFADWLRSKHPCNCPSPEWSHIYGFVREYLPVWWNIRCRQWEASGEFPELSEGYRHQSNCTGSGIVDVGHYEWFREITPSDNVVLTYSAD